MNGRSGIPSRAIRSIAQLRPVASSSPVVDAFVASLASSPVSHRLIRSGTSAIASLVAAAALPRSDIS